MTDKKRITVVGGTLPEQLMKALNEIGFEDEQVDMLLTNPYVDLPFLDLPPINTSPDYWKPRKKGKVKKW